jgi:signal transduction histidine kinase
MKINLHLVFVVTLLFFLVKFIFSSAYSYEYLHQLKRQKDIALVNDVAHIQLALINADNLPSSLANRFEQNVSLLQQKLSSNQPSSLELISSAVKPASQEIGNFLVENANLTTSQTNELLETLRKVGEAKFTAFYKNHQVYLTYTLYDPIDLSWLIVSLLISAGLVLMIFGWWWIFIYYEKKLPSRLFAALTGESSEKNSTDPVIQKLKDKIEKHYQEKSIMLTALSHDIKTPLTEAMLKLELVESPEFLEMAASIRKNLEQINAVIKTSLDYAKDANNLEKVELDLVSFIQNILEAYRSQILNKSIRFKSEEPEILAFFEIGLMRRLIVNLIENALKYGSIIEISLKKDSLNRRVILEVQDNGVGVPEQSLLLLGAPYYRVDQSRSRSTGGTGLGLAIVKKIAVLHGGSVEFENRAGDLGGGLCVRAFINVDA